MLISANDAIAILGDDDATALSNDMIRTRALVNCFTELGEAASKITPAGRALAGDLPWRDMVGMRNIVVHIYWGIDLNELVKTVREDLPRLVQSLENALERWPDA